MTRFACPYLDCEVELSEERERHISERHPELLPKFQERVAPTLADPDEVRRTARLANARLFSRRFDDTIGGQARRGGCGQRGCSAPPLGDYSLRRHKAGPRRSGVEAKLTFKYDREADILHIDKRPPYAEQESEELG